MIGDSLYRGYETAVPKTVKSVCPSVVAEPVHTRQPYLLAVLVEYPAAVCVKPVVPLNGVLVSRQKRLYIDSSISAAIVIVLIIVVLLILVYNALCESAVTAVQLGAFYAEF